MPNVEALDFAALVQKHVARGIVVDTNILVLWLVGQHDLQLVGRFKRTQTFTRQDFTLLHALLHRFAKIMTTPGVLAEVNSLCGQLPKQTWSAFLGTFKRHVGLLDEQHVPSKEAAEHLHFAKCGLTDSAIMTIAQDHRLVLTDDFKLAGYLEALGIDCVNFNHIRYFSEE